MADTKAFAPVADAYVSASHPGKNYGGSRNLVVDGRPVKRTYLSFEIRLPAGARITGARLRLRTHTRSARSGFRVYAVRGTAWRERRITYKHRPHFGARLGRSPAWSSRGYRSARLRARSIRSGRITLGVATRGRASKAFSAREGAKRPKLAVRYTRAAPRPSPTPTPTGPSRAPLEPAHGTLLGAFHKNVPADSWSMTEYASFESKVGRKLDIDHRYHPWGSTYWPYGADAWDVSNGRIPMESLGGSVPPLDAIASGSQDAWLSGLADRIKAFGSPVFFRPMWEMNGEWMVWSGAGNNTSGKTDGPAKYVAAWRRMHDIFGRRGATNAVWVWSPNCSDEPREGWNHWTNYYPGDAYVDWVACDGYNWGSSRSYSRWESFGQVFGTSPSVYADYPQKPFMVAETASCEQGGDKGQWYRDALRTIPSAFPRIKAVVAFDEYAEPSISCDWRITSSPSALNGFKAMAAQPYFNP